METQTTIGKTIKKLLVLLVISGSVYTTKAIHPDLDTTGVWLEVNDGFAVCPGIGESGGIASIFNEHFIVYEMLHRRNLAYAVIQYKNAGCEPRMYEHDTVTNKWVCVAQFEENKGFVNGYGRFTAVFYTNGKDIYAWTYKAEVYKFTKDWANYPTGWKKIT
jgi:hypothetical protein